MRKWISNIAGGFLLALGVVAKYGGWFMDALEIPEIPQKIKSIASFYTPGHTPYYLMAFATIFLVAVNWRSIKDWLNAENKPSQPQKPAPKIERDVWLLHALHFIAFKTWEFEERPIQSEFMEPLGEAVNAVEQKAYDGDLPVWGVIGENPLYREIPKDYWDGHYLDFLSQISSYPEHVKSARKDSCDDHTIYHSLKTSKAKVEELWPVVQEGRA